MIEEKISKMGLDVSAWPAPLATYIPAIRHGDLVFTAGQITLADGAIKFAGKVGKDLNEEEGIKAAELCALNCLRVIKTVVGNLDNVERIIKVTVFVNSAEGFTAQPKIANGASDFLVEVFGENGRHVRSAVGVNVLPLNSAVEIEMIVKVK